MPDLPVSAATAAFAALFLVALSLPITLRRMTTSVSLGVGSDETLERWVRAQGNYAEYMPIGLIALTLAESLAPEGPLIPVAAGALVSGRLLHAAALWGAGFPLRVVGMVLTYTGLMAAAAQIIAASV